jgi:hypothetical protein
MSLWTPDGERPVPPRAGDGAPADEPVAGPSDADLADLSPEDRQQLEAMQAEMAQVREQLLQAPASVVVSNHAMGIYELAALHLTTEQPKLGEAVLAIDALTALVEGLEGRLGEAEPTLREALAQLRAAYLEVKSRAAG